MLNKTGGNEYLSQYWINNADHYTINRLTEQLNREMEKWSSVLYEGEGYRAVEKKTHANDI